MILKHWAALATLTATFCGATAWSQTPPAATAPAKIAFKPQKLPDAPGSTVVSKWKDAKVCCFMLEFDDSCPSQIKTVIPELEKRGLVGTFYIVPNWGQYKGNQTAWTKASASPSVVLANHTFNHGDVTSVEQFNSELKKCNDAINSLFPNVKQPRLISFGQPGGVKWGITDQQINEELPKYNLIARPSFYGPPFHQHSAAEVQAVLDTAINKGVMGHVDFHGVGGDANITPVEWFIPLLDKIVDNKDKVWLTDPISWHKYICERNTATIKVVHNTDQFICLQLTSTVDPALYDQPLTLTTRVPAAWTAAAVTQGKITKKTVAKDGQVQYEAIPGETVVEIHGN